MHRDGKVWLASLILVMLGQIAVAAEWKLTGTLEQGVEYDDNIAMRVDATPAFGYLLRPSLSANWNTAVMNLGITGNGDIRRYDDERWDCDSFSLGLNQRYLRQRNVFSLAGGYSQSCSYSQQIADTGILVPNNQSESYNLAPAWNWQWTPRDQLSLSPTYSQTSYSAVGSANNIGTGVGYQSNKTYGVDLSENHQWSQRLSFNGGLSFSHTEYTGTGTSTYTGTGASTQNVSGFQLGGEYAITRYWSVNAGGGGRWVQRPMTYNSPGSDGDNSLLFTQVSNLTLSYTGRSMDYSLGYSRTVNPSAFGQASEYNSVNTKYSYQFTRDLSFSLDGSFLNSQAVGQSVNQAAQNRTYYTASTGLVWKFVRDWQLSASYRYRRQEYPDVEGVQAANAFSDAQVSNALMLHLKYNWNGLRGSR